MILNLITLQNYCRVLRYKSIIFENTYFKCNKLLFLGKSELLNLNSLK